MSRVFVRSLMAALTGLVLTFGLAAGPVRADAPLVLVPQGHGPLTGDPLPGGYLHADLGTWNAAPESYTFQWLRDGVAVPGATTQDYLVPVTDVGHALAVQVTAAKTDYSPAGFTSEAVTVHKIASTLTLQVKKARLPGQDGKVWVATAQVRPERLWEISGTVQVFDGSASKVLASGAVSRDLAVIKLPGRKLRTGKHKLAACYAGNDAIAGSCSAVVVVRADKSKPRG